MTERTMSITCVIEASTTEGMKTQLQNKMQSMCPGVPFEVPGIRVVPASGEAGPPWKYHLNVQMKIMI